jgi:hypothetical protein
MKHANTNTLCAALVIALCACANAASPTDEQPAVGTMRVAKAVGKMGAPVEVRYEPTGTTVRGQPITLKLAFVPQIAGSELSVEFPATEAVSIDSAVSRMSVPKAEREAVYRRTLIVTPRLGDTADLRVMVWLEAEGGRYFSIFTIPVGK